MSDPFAAPGDTLDVRYRSAEQVRAGGALGNLASGPEITSHGTPARLVAWPGTGFLTEAVHVLTLEPGHEGERYRYDLAEEAFLCHSGSAEVWLRERWVKLEPGDLAYIPEGVERAVRNSGEETGVLVAQITPPQIDLYVDHGLYNVELAVINQEAAAKARATAPTAALPEARFAYRETHPELRAWNLEPEDVRREGALFNALMGTPFSGIGLPMRLILWPGAGTRSVGFNYAYDPDGVTDTLHTHPVSDECLVMWAGRGRFFIGGQWVDAQANDVALAPCGVAHRTSASGTEPTSGASPLRPSLTCCCPPTSTPTASSPRHRRSDCERRTSSPWRVAHPPPPPRFASPRTSRHRRGCPVTRTTPTCSARSRSARRDGTSGR